MALTLNSGRRLGRLGRYGALAIGMLAAGRVAAEPLADGAAIFQGQCARCHGDQGQGVAEEYDQALAGEKSIEELAALIAETMPPDDPAACVGDDARRVAAYVYERFYSPEARRRQGLAAGPRVELVRLTVPQFRNAVADVIGSLAAAQQGSPGREASASAPAAERGLQGEYYQSDGMNKADQQKLTRIDAEINFDFGAGGPGGDIAADQFAIIWRGSLVADETGFYEFRLETENGARLYLNNDGLDERGKLRDDSGSAGAPALIDAWVSSGQRRVESARVFLLGGRRYPVQLEFFKYLEKTASIRFEWRPPQGVWSVVRGEVLSPQWAPRTYVVDEPFPADDRSLGYERGASASAEWLAAVNRAALAAADEVVDRLEALAGVEQASAENVERLREFVLELMSAAFRRPLAEEERQRYGQRLFTEGESPERAVRRGVLAAFTSPEFLYADLTPAGERPSPHAVASRLALALWDSIPDAALRKAADEGRLATAEQLEDEARRLLASPLAREKMRRFFAHWLEIEDRDLAKDSQQFPEFNEQRAADLRRSLMLFVEGVLWSERSDYRELLLADYLLLNPALKALYGPPAAAGSASSAAGEQASHEAEFSRVALDPDERSGILTHPYLLSAFAYHNNSSPIHRGVFLTRNIMGRGLKPPPMAVAFKDAEFDPSLTMREKVTELTRDSACMTCHSVINPLGFALENYDAVGQWRTTEKDKPIDPRGDYVTPEGQIVPLQGARDIAEFAALSESAHRALVVQLFQHLVQQNPDAYGSDAVARLRREFAGDAFNLQNLMVRVAAQAAAGPPIAPE